MENKEAAMDASFIRIVSSTGRRPVECSCRQCRSQCRVPCLGTPDDILRLIRAGHAGKLRLTLWCVGLALGELPAPIPMVQPGQTDAGCVFFRDGLCELHHSGLKPTEGKLSCHDIWPGCFSFRSSLAWHVAKEWTRKDNFHKVAQAIALAGPYQKGIDT